MFQFNWMMGTFKSQLTLFRRKKEENKQLWRPTT